MKFEDFSFREKLEWLDKNKYYYNTTIILKEKEESGKTELEFSSRNRLFGISLSKSNRISVFKRQKVADWIIIEFLDNNSRINLHIVELKRTVDEWSWLKIKKQFEGALQHSYLLKGLFSYEINGINFYTAYVNDNLKPETTPNPVNLKDILDWGRERIIVLGRQFLHKEIKLELEDGVAKGIYKIV